MHIGLIGGIGPAATELYYRGLVARHVGSTTPLSLTIVHADQADLIRAMTAGDAHAQARRFLQHVDSLEAAGAEIVALASIAAHFCVTELAAMSGLPILDILPTINADVSSRALRKVGLLGTYLAMTSRLYGGLEAAVVTPAGAELDRVHECYLAMAQAGRATAWQRDVLVEAGRRLVVEQGAEAVLLGGTDLFLAFADTTGDYIVIDCAEIHVDALHRAAVAPGRRASTDRGT